MKKIIFILLLSFIAPLAGKVQAQVKKGDFQKLFDWYAMERYEKCAYKAESYTRRKKYKREPEPYLYLALCLYQGHMNPDKYDFTEDFRDPIKDALKYAYKFRRYDKDGTLYEENREQLDKIRELGLERALYYFSDEDFYKAQSEFKRIMKVIPDDPNIVMMTGVSMCLARNTTQGERLVEQALDSLELFREEDRFVKDDVTHEALIKAFVSYTNYLQENNRMEEALEVIAFGRKLVPDNITLKAQYRKLYADAPDEDEEESEETDEDDPLNDGDNNPWH